MSACVTWLDLSPMSLIAVWFIQVRHYPSSIDQSIYPSNVISRPDLYTQCSQRALFLCSLVSGWTFNGCNVCQCINSALRFQGFLCPAPAASNSKHSEQKPRGWHKKFARFHAIQDNMCTIRQKFSELFALAWHSAQTVNRHLETFLFSLNKISPPCHNFSLLFSEMQLIINYNYI